MASDFDCQSAGSVGSLSSTRNERAASVDRERARDFDQRRTRHRSHGNVRCECRGLRREQQGRVVDNGMRTEISSCRRPAVEVDLHAIGRHRVRDEQAHREGVLTPGRQGSRQAGDV